MDNQASTFEQTMRALQCRAGFFKSQRLSAENTLVLIPSNYNVRSLSEIYTPLGNYNLHETPVNTNLSDIYSTKINNRNAENENIDEVKYILPEVSDGEQSIDHDKLFDPNFKWLCNHLLDSNLLSVDQMQPKKVERGKIPGEWIGINELLIFNIEKRIHIKSDAKEIEDYLKNRFGKYPWVRLKKMKQVYFKSKASIMLKFIDEKSSSFAYFNLNNKEVKQFFGPQTEIYRITQNRISKKWTDAVVLIFRYLPISLNRENLLRLFKPEEIIFWMEQLAEINGYKYTLCSTKYLQHAFTIYTTFQQKNIRDAKINLHPYSAKIWQQTELHLL